MMDAPNLESLQALTPVAIVREFSGGRIRQEAVRDAALSLGARGGFAKRTKDINDNLEKRGTQLDQIFNFSMLMISSPTGQSKTAQYLIRPPVITEGDNSLNASSDDELKIADQIFHIDSQAKFVTAPPTWREYLAGTKIEPVEPPDGSLMPKDSSERELWKKWIAQGWNAGVKQADVVFDYSLSRLTRDYNGMVRYKTLLKQNMVSSPYVAESRMGVTGGGADMSVDSRILRITAKPSLQINTTNWKPIFYATPIERKK